MAGSPEPSSYKWSCSKCAGTETLIKRHDGSASASPINWTYDCIATANIKTNCDIYN